jgi:hypothetical protein
MSAKFQLGFLLFGGVILASEKMFFPSLSVGVLISILIFIDIFLLFSTHVALTYISYSCLPEIRLGLRGSTSVIPIGPITLISAFAILFCFFLAIGALCSTQFGIFFIIFYQALNTILFFHHDIAQKFGICSLYDKRDGRETSFAQRHLLTGFLLLIILDQVAGGFPFFYGTTDNSFFSLNSHLLQTLGHVRAALAFAMLCLITLLLRGARRSGEKFLFLGRLIFYAAMPFTVSSLFLVRILHGHEYLMINRQMFTSSAAKARGFRFLVPAVFFLMVISILAVANYLPIDHRTLLRPPSRVLQVALAFYYALIFMHYGMDRLIFRMREPSIRENVGKLLLGATSR